MADYRIRKTDSLSGITETSFVDYQEVLVPKSGGTFTGAVSVTSLDAANIFSGGTNILDIFTGSTSPSVPINYFNAYDNIGGTSANVTGIWVDIPLNTQRFADVDFTHSTITNNQEVTINTDGTYLVMGLTSTIGGVGNNRSEAQSRLMLNTGSGFVQVNGTIGEMYVRQRDYGSTASFVTPLTLSAGDKLKMQFRRTQGGTSVQLVGGASSLTIVNIKGPKGDKGDTGTSTGLTVDRQAVQLTGSTTTTSTTPVDLNGMSITTKNLGGPASYLINFSCSRGNTVSNVINNFYINVDGVRIRNAITRTFSNEIHIVSLTAIADNITSGTVIKIEYDAEGGGSHTVFNRSLTIDGTLDANII